MGVVALVVKGGIPTEILKRNLHSFGHLRRKGGEQPSPAFGVVIAEPDSVLPPQGEDGQPEVAGVVGHLLRHLKEILHTALLEVRAGCLEGRRIAQESGG